jgi:hypothetical protein
MDWGYGVRARLVTRRFEKVWDTCNASSATELRQRHVYGCLDNGITARRINLLYTLALHATFVYLFFHQLVGMLERHLRQATPTTLIVDIVRPRQQSFHIRP